MDTGREREQGGSPLIIGVGNEFRSDDGLGVYLARELRRRLPQSVRVVEHGGEGASLMETWKGAPVLMVIDAVASQEEPGFVHRYDASHDPVPAGFYHYSSHEFGVAAAVEMARQLGQLPPVVLLYGIEGERYDMGTGLSDSVIQGIPHLLAALEHDLAALASLEEAG